MGKIYSVTVDNHASHSACFMVFQSDPTQWAPNALSLAWFARYSNPGQNSRTRFEWTADTGFSWAETGELQPGIQFAAAETYEPTGGSNRISLDWENGVYRFAYPSWGADPARFYLAETANIPARSQACVGVTMSGSTVYAVQARPNQNLAFSPRPRYFIAYGDYQQGDVIDVSTVNNPLELSFPTGVHALTTTLHADGSWTRPISLARANEQRLRLLSI
jgi:rhizosphere induced protein